MSKLKPQPMRPSRVAAEESAPAGVGRQAAPSPGGEGVGHAIAATGSCMREGGSEAAARGARTTGGASCYPPACPED